MIQSAWIRAVNLLLSMAALFAGMVLVYVITRGDQLLVSPAKFGLFVGTPVALLTLAMGLRLTRPEVRALWTVMLVAIGAGVYAAELYFVVDKFSATPGFSAPKTEEPSNDARSPWEVIRDMRAEGARAVPAIVPEYLLKTTVSGELRSPIRISGSEVLPLSGVANRPTVLCNEAGYYVSYDSDDHGFNNPPGMWKVGKADIVALGDSFVHGYCVNGARNFISLIRDHYPTTVNLGTSGAGPLIALASLMEFGPLLRPRKVLWFFFEGNDIPSNLEVESRAPLLMRYLETGKTQNLVERRDAVMAALSDHVETIVATKKSGTASDAGTLQHIISFIGLAELRARLGMPTTLDQPDFDLFRQILETAQSVVAGWGGDLVFVYLPTWSSVAEEGEDKAYSAIREPVQKIVSELGIPLIDVYQSFRRHPNPRDLFPNPSAHYGDLGHARVADEVLRHLDGS